MDSDQRRQLISKIESEINAETEKIAQLKELTKPVSPDNAIGRVSRMDAINNKSINEEGLRKANNRLLKLKRALERKEKEEFGRCLACGEEIRFERMMFMPESTRCISCARKGK